MAGQANGGQVTKPNPLNQGKYVGNPNQGNVDRQGNPLPPILNKQGQGFGGAAVPEYMKGFQAPGISTMDSRMFTKNRFKLIHWCFT